MKPLRVGLALVLMTASAAITANASTISTPEQQVMTLVNRARAANGLVPLRSDGHLWALAGERSAAMASADVLSHGAVGSLADGLSRRGIQWYTHGEVIAYWSASGSAAASQLFELWAASPPHWALLMSSAFNYLGVGMTVSASGATYGSVVLTESRDRTGARGTTVRATVSGDDVRWTWRGYDPRLQTHTAGLRDFEVQQRTDRGSWVTVSTATASTARSAVNRARGHWYGLRVRARDRAGNVGPWSAELRGWVP
jgi:hypothetical protein